MLVTGELSPADMNYTIKQIWWLYSDFPSILSLYFTASAVHNYIVFLWPNGAPKASPLLGTVCL